MKAVIQRVKQAEVRENNKLIAKIGKGYLVFLGIAKDDDEKKLDWMIRKVINLRVMEDEQEHMNLSLEDAGGEMLIVSQFTLLANCEKGNRPSFINAARPSKAEKMYNEFIKRAKKSGLKVKSGKFRAMMDVELTNDGPVTIIIEK
jgi:D-tyrosyl-tRNA(Tyr) deacylase